MTIAHLKTQVPISTFVTEKDYTLRYLHIVNIETFFLLKLRSSLVFKV